MKFEDLPLETQQDIQVRFTNASQLRDGRPKIFIPVILPFVGFAKANEPPPLTPRLKAVFELKRQPDGSANYSFSRVE